MQKFYHKSKRVWIATQQRKSVKVMPAGRQCLFAFLLIYDYLTHNFHAYKKFCDIEFSVEFVEIFLPLVILVLASEALLLRQLYLVK